MPPIKKKPKHIPARPPTLKDIMDRLADIEELIRNMCGKQCLDFSLMPGATMTNPFTIAAGGHKLTFTTTQSIPFQVTPQSPSTVPGLNIPYDLTVDISPPCPQLTMEISNYSGTNCRAYNSAGPIPITPPPPYYTNSTIILTTGPDVKKLEFRNANEERIIRICC